MVRITVLSLGAGVQSTTLALMAVEGVLPKPDAVIFADTGWEPKRVYDHLEKLRDHLWHNGIRTYKEAKGNLRDDAIDPEHHYASIPYFVRNPDGSEGMGRRQCTAEYKLAVINRRVRRLLGANPPDYRRVPKGNVAEQWIGFSTDEIGRVSDYGSVSYIEKRYPLIEMGMTRRQCEMWLASRDWDSVQKSACIGCPYHGNAQWRALRDTCRCGHHCDDHYDKFGFWPRINESAGRGTGRCANCECECFDAPEWDDAVAFDEAIRNGGARGQPLNGEAFLHRSRVPLSIAPIDHRTRAERRGEQLDLTDEFGDPDGCSPYGCRSGQPIEAATR